jgi:hypothetical protein
MKIKKTISNSEINKIIYNYYDSKVKSIKSKYSFIKHSDKDNVENFTLRKNKIIDFVFVTTLAIVISICFIFHDKYRTLEKSATEFCIYYNIDKHIAEILTNIKRSFKYF